MLVYIAYGVTTDNYGTDHCSKTTVIEHVFGSLELAKKWINSHKEMEVLYPDNAYERVVYSSWRDGEHYYEEVMYGDKCVRRNYYFKIVEVEGP